MAGVKVHLAGGGVGIAENDEYLSWFPEPETRRSALFFMLEQQRLVAGELFRG